MYVFNITRGGEKRLFFFLRLVEGGGKNLGTGRKAT